MRASARLRDNVESEIVRTIATLCQQAFAPASRRCPIAGGRVWSSGKPKGIDYLNHGCKPNARVEQQLYVHADGDIETGGKITADCLNFVSQGIREPRCAN